MNILFIDDCKQPDTFKHPTEDRFLEDHEVMLAKDYWEGKRQIIRTINEKGFKWDYIYIDYNLGDRRLTGHSLLGMMFSAEFSDNGPVAKKVFCISADSTWAGQMYNTCKELIEEKVIEDADIIKVG